MEKTLILEHYSVKSLSIAMLKDMEQTSPLFKPTGLWVSVQGEEDWPSWCRLEEFGNIDSKLKYFVTLKNSANILNIQTDIEIVEFTDRYKADLPGWVDWRKVAKKYDGIIIPVYKWKYRLDPYTLWYYCWDCASGCIWNVKNTVKSIIEENNGNKEGKARDQIVQI